MSQPSSLVAAHTLFQEALVLMDAGETARACECLHEACRQAPHFSEAWTNLGYLLASGGDAAGAERCYRQARQLGSAHPRLYLNYGALLAARGLRAEAEAIYREGLDAAPDDADLWSNLGVLFANLKRDTYAEFCLRTALEIAPDHRNARYNLGYLQLCQGKYREGFAAFEARDWRNPLDAALDAAGLARWRGEPLGGQRILIGCEAGHGDMIQFCRYVGVLRERGAARVDILCHAGLRRLFTGLAGVGRVMAYEPSLQLETTDWDYWSPAMSLPHACGSDLADLPGRRPYLFPFAGDALRWRQRLADALPAGALRVGLAWRGSPRFENDRERSLPGPQLFAPLATVPGVAFVNLQKHLSPAEAAALPPGTLDAGSALDDFADTAALVDALDLVISVDTAIAHLAGALGKRCWVMLPAYATDWRWGRHDDDAPWYPGVLRLFRQTDPGDWHPVIEALTHALAAQRAPHAEPATCAARAT
ncbi:MAG: tetratricopeptide repeat protein [Candidatus Dactylopiibacterium sp.]|nr:tetratricopeptide repeat protein [Candidatus Dactylopiibacterium sp.]